MAYIPITLALNSIKTVTIPNYHDPDIETVTPYLSEPVISSGITSITMELTNPNLITLSPVGFTEVGIHTVKVKLEDTCGSSLINDISITVTNSAPYFTV